MCGRFTRQYTWRQVHDFLDLHFPQFEEMAPSYNAAPTQIEPVCRLNKDGQRELTPMKWGLVPSWSKEPGSGFINARAETAATKPTFRSAFANRRCLVPVSGFYEWKKVGKGKQPFYIRLLNDPIMCFAGLWERHGKDDEAEDTFTIITTEPNELMVGIHNRMPVILRPDQFDAWLHPDAPSQPALAPFPAKEMEAFEVSTRVNSPKNNDPSLLKREGEDDEPTSLWGAAS